MFSMKRSALKYYGGKWKMAPKIIKMFPAHKVYVEPFGGGGSILLRKDRSYNEVYNDIDSSVVRYFRVLRDFPNMLISKILLTPYSREEFEFCISDNDTEDEIELARRYFIRSWMSIMGANKNKKPRNSDFSYHIKRSNTNCIPKESDLYAIVDRLTDFMIEHLDFEDCIHRYDSEETLFYVDPPYYGKCGDAYQNNISEEDHIRLSKTLKTIKGFACISGTQSDFYDRLYSYWKTIEFPAINAMNVIKTEKLWMNYEFDV